ncbi:MAG: Asp-tRNA(Asn)/Glu-tRNA(Gln) amidotransferase subunit GatC [Candidatus Saccharibacteria bacterium]
MSKLTRQDILKLAKLSRLQLTDAEVKQLEIEIGSILKYVEQLQSVNLDGIEPTYQVTGLKDVTRADKVIDYQANPTDLLKNAPVTEKSHFKVKRMVN